MIERLPEINRVLRAVQVLARDLPSVPVDAVILRCREAVIEGLLPEHERTLDFAVTLGLLLTQHAEVCLTEDGVAFLTMNADESYELSADQIRYLVRRHYFDGALRASSKELLAAFSPSYTPARFTWSATDNPELPGALWLIEHLCQLGVLERIADGLQTTEVYTPIVGSFRDEPKGMTEERLREYLREKKEIGDLGEELIAAYEQRRLRDAGFLVESTCVRRISKLRENAGYDIESFDGAAPGLTFDRFIEVKGARSKDLHFFWSANEMKVAEDLGAKYWIYFQGGIDMQNKAAKCEPLLFQDPIKSILSDAQITRTPQGLLVQAKLQGAQR